MSVFVCVGWSYVLHVRVCSNVITKVILLSIYSIGDKSLKMAVVLTEDIIKIVFLKERLSLDLYLAQSKEVTNFANYTPTDGVAFLHAWECAAAQSRSPSPSARRCARR